jgi:16S rRNA (guanine527-N7)-methyltransferase
MVLSGASKQMQQQSEEAFRNSLSEKQEKLLVEHLHFVIEQNKKLNLTSIGDEEQGRILHIEDSLAALPELEAAPSGSLIDLGSGAGFPGIPLAIVSQRDTTLVEATKKKAQVLKDFVQGKGLENQITVAALRAEELARRKTECFAVATARALSSLPALMELASPLLQIGGILVAYKGNVPESELNKAELLEKALGMTIGSIRSFTLSDGLTKRTIVQIVKTAYAEKQLPRRNGQAQNHPF